MEIAFFISVGFIVFLLVLIFKLNKKVADVSAQLNQTQLEAAGIKTSYEQLKTDKEKLLDEKRLLSVEQQQLVEEKHAISVELAKLKERAEVEAVEREKLQQESENRFRLLANEIFANESQKFRTSSEGRLVELLNPLKVNIEEFRKNIDEKYNNEAKERFALQNHLKDLMQLNESIGKEARELTEALRGNAKVQGDWGEMILESILERSGLIRDENYFVQATKHEDGTLITGEDGRQIRPDVVVKLPDNKCIVIDSKVSLTAYTNFVNAATEEEQEKYGKAHVASVRAHFKELDAKKYQDYVGMDAQSRIDFVLMFIPNEHAYISAMSLDKTLWQEAYDKRIVIISPAHVISTLRLIAQLWTRDRQTKNAIEIAEQSGNLYDKFVGFVKDMEEIQTGLKKAQSAYDGAVNKLSEGKGNLISRVENLKTLGAKAKKSLPSAE